MRRSGPRIVYRFCRAFTTIRLESDEDIPIGYTGKEEFPIQYMHIAGSFTPGLVISLLCRFGNIMEPSLILFHGNGIDGGFSQMFIGTPIVIVRHTIQETCDKFLSVLRYPIEGVTLILQPMDHVGYTL